MKELPKNYYMDYLFVWPLDLNLVVHTLYNTIHAINEHYLMTWCIERQLFLLTLIYVIDIDTIARTTT
jgi:hypothetical protein